MRSASVLMVPGLAAGVLSTLLVSADVAAQCYDDRQRVSLRSDGSPIIYTTECCVLDTEGAFQEAFKGPIHCSVNGNGTLFSFSTNACDTTAQWAALSQQLGQRVHHHYVKRLGGALLLATSDGQGNPARDGFGVTSFLAPDGAALVFAHNSADLAGYGTDTSKQRMRVYLKDLASGTLTLLTPDGGPGTSTDPQIVGSNGSYKIIYASNAVGHLFTPAKTFGPHELFLVDSSAPLIPVCLSEGIGDPTFPVKNPQISADGTCVSFWRKKSLYVAATDGSYSAEIVSDVFAFRGKPAVSSQGQFIAYDAWLVGEPKSQVFVYDAMNGTHTMISTDGSGVDGDDHSVYPAITDDGMFVAYLSSATNIEPGSLDEEMDNGVPVNILDVFLHNRFDGTTCLLTPGTSRQCALPEVAGGTADGKVWVAFPTNSCESEMGVLSGDNCVNCETSYELTFCAEESDDAAGSPFEPCYDVYRVRFDLTSGN